MADELDLSQFCSTDGMRPELAKPITQGDYTYAADGHIAVRVAKREGVEHGEKGEALESLFALHTPGKLIPLPAVEWPESARTNCWKCDGRGKRHECPSCNCPCPDCAGVGKLACPQSKASVGIGLGIIDAKFYRQIAALPNPKIVLPMGNMDPIPFTFDGGSGIVMPVRVKLAAHVEASAP